VLRWWDGGGLGKEGSGTGTESGGVDPDTQAKWSNLCDNLSDIWESTDAQ
jgi:hypothetical protein